jgi:hypothetical protein
MYFTFGVPFIPVPTTIMAGIQPIGIRPGVFLSTDGPGITASVKIDPATIKFVWAKALENQDWESDDADLYALEVNAKLATFTVGGYGVLFNANTWSRERSMPPTLITDRVCGSGFMQMARQAPEYQFRLIYDWVRTKTGAPYSGPRCRLRGWEQSSTWASRGRNSCLDFLNLRVRC